MEIILGFYSNPSLEVKDGHGPRLLGFYDHINGTSKDKTSNIHHLFSARRSMDAEINQNKRARDRDENTQTPVFFNIFRHQNEIFIN